MNKLLPVHEHDFLHDRWSLRRYKLTLAFVKKHLEPGSRILDLGTVNGLGNYMKENGYLVYNTRGEDLDIHQFFLRNFNVEAVTSFEIFEHLMNPFDVLRNLPGRKLVASVPLSLWFAPAFRHPDNPAGRHFHEFERWQFDWLLEKTGWKIIDSATYTSPSLNPGLRTVLRWFTPRWYIIYSEKI